jgi:hypothetical protein
MLPAIQMTHKMGGLALGGTILVLIFLLGCASSEVARVPATAPRNPDYFGPVLQGHVTDTDGNAIRGVKVILHAGFATRWQVAETLTDSGGRYRFAPPQGSRIKNEAQNRWDYYVGMTVDHPLFKPEGQTWWDVTVPDEPGGVTEQDFVLTRKPEP